MPTYDYLCEKCGAEFFKVMTIREYETEKVTCPRCQSDQVKRQLTGFIAQTSRKS